jgi:hypothetical protein
MQYGRSSNDVLFFGPEMTVSQIMYNGHIVVGS